MIGYRYGKKNRNELGGSSTSPNSSNRNRYRYNLKPILGSRTYLRNKMNAVINATLTLSLAKENLEKLIALGLDTDEDYDQVYWAEQELKRLCR